MAHYEPMGSEETNPDDRCMNDGLRRWQRDELARRLRGIGDERDFYSKNSARNSADEHEAKLLNEKALFLLNTVRALFPRRSRFARALKAERDGENVIAAQRLEDAIISEQEAIAAMAK